MSHAHKMLMQRTGDNVLGLLLFCVVFPFVLLVVGFYLLVDIKQSLSAFLKSP